MPEFQADHGRICAEFMLRSRAYLDDGQLLQASEKGWGAAAHAAIFIAGIRGWHYHEHWQFAAEVMLNLARETGRWEVQQWGRSGEELHRNFYNDNLTAPQIAAHLDNVANLVNLIRQQTNLPPVDD